MTIKAIIITLIVCAICGVGLVKLRRMLVEDATWLYEHWEDRK